LSFEGVFGVLEFPVLAFQTVVFVLKVLLFVFELPVLVHEAAILTLKGFVLAFELGVLALKSPFLVLEVQEVKITVK